MKTEISNRAHKIDHKDVQLKYVENSVDFNLKKIEKKIQVKTRNDVEFVKDKIPVPTTQESTNFSAMNYKDKNKTTGQLSIKLNNLQGNTPKMREM